MKHIIVLLLFFSFNATAAEFQFHLGTQPEVRAGDHGYSMSLGVDREKNPYLGFNYQHNNWLIRAGAIDGSYEWEGETDSAAETNLYQTKDVTTNSPFVGLAYSADSWELGVMSTQREFESTRGRIINAKVFPPIAETEDLDRTEVDTFAYINYIFRF